MSLADSKPVDPAPVELLVQLACLLDVATPKPGNVSVLRRFADTTWLDFALAGAAAAPEIARAAERPLGESVLRAVEASRRAVPRNVNLGIVLLLTPLAAVRRDERWSEGLDRVLRSLGPCDAAAVYAAIRLAAPGGLGEAPEADVRDPAPPDLLAAMRLAAGRDLVARQWANGFTEVIDEGAPAIARSLESGLELEEAVVRCHIELLARHPDGLIARKLGAAVAQEASTRARAALEEAAEAPERAARSWARLDEWLRADGNRRNPGTTADLVVASLFLALRAGIIALPLPRRDAGAGDRGPSGGP